MAYGALVVTLNALPRQCFRGCSADVPAVTQAQASLANEAILLREAREMA